MKKQESYITLNKLKFYAYHGVLPQESKVGNTFVVSVVIRADLNQAIESDNLIYTLNYADIYTAIKAEMSTPSQLLEHVCGRIVKRLFNDFPRIETIDIELTKQNPPMGADLESAGVRMYCER